jgi:hypothetical protein
MIRCIPLRYFEEIYRNSTGLSSPNDLNAKKGNQQSVNQKASFVKIAEDNVFLVMAIRNW